MAVHIILLIILPNTYIACEQALNNYASLSAMNSYFGFQTQKFPGFQNPDYLTLGDTF